MGKAAQYPDECLKLISDNGYRPEQVFNAAETELFWERMRNKTYISVNEKSASEFKTAKDKVMLLLCSNASGDCLIKPLILYKSLNPDILRNKNKDDLPVFWRANKKACITSTIFTDWFVNCFVHEVEIYLNKMNIDFKAVLILDNAPNHPHKLQGAHPNLKVIFWSPNTAALLQPMNRGIFQIFKLCYIRRTFKIILDTIKNDLNKDIIQCWKNYDIAKCITCIKESLQDLKQSTSKMVGTKCGQRTYLLTVVNNYNPMIFRSCLTLKMKT